MVGSVAVFILGTEHSLSTACSVLMAPYRASSSSYSVLTTTRHAANATMRIRRAEVFVSRADASKLSAEPPTTRTETTMTFVPVGRRFRSVPISATLKAPISATLKTARKGYPFAQKPYDVEVTMSSADASKTSTEATMSGAETRTADALSRSASADDVIGALRVHGDCFFKPYRVVCLCTHIRCRWMTSLRYGTFSKIV